MMTDLLMAFFLTRDEKYNPQHQQTGVLLFTGDRENPRKGNLAQVICAVIILHMLCLTYVLHMLWIT